MKIIGRYKFLTSDGKESPWHKNRIMLGTGTGMNLFIRQLGADTTYGIAATKLKLGTGTTAVATSQADLATPTVDNIIVTNRIFVGDDEVQLKFFATDLQVANATYNEVGIFVGSQMFTRSLISPAFVKASGVDTTILYSISVTT
jgi:hypothetical protein